MEKSFVNDFYRFIKEDEFLCQNMRQISTQIKKIKKKFFDNQKEFNIIVYYFKKISKDSTIVQIIINRYMFELTFDFTFLTKETRKEQRLNFSSNLLDEIIDNFSGYSNLKVWSDSLIYLGGYTLRCLLKESSFAKSLDFNNFMIYMDIDNTNHFRQLNNLKELETLIIYFHYEKLDSQRFLELLNILFSVKHLKKACINIYFKIIDISSFFDKNMLKIKNMSINNISDIELNLIKYDPDKSILQSDQQKGLIVPLFLIVMNMYWPSYFEFNYNEIIGDINEKPQYIFKNINIKYSKEYCFTLNLLKDVIFSKHTKKGLSSTFGNIFSTFSKFTISSDKLFKPTFLNLGLSFNNIKEINLLKWTVDFLHELNGFKSRKVTADDIILSLNNKPTESEIKFKPFIQLKQNDLNFISRILSKIEGHQKIVLNNGDTIIIGGRIKLFVNQMESVCALNTVITMDIHYSKMKIYNYSDNYFIPHFNAAAGKLSENNIIVVGGISVSSLLENFKFTPIFIINTNNFSIERILPESYFYPGIIFNHKLHLSKDKFQISDGYTITNVDQLNIVNQSEKQPSNVMKNTSIYEFDINKNNWKLYVNTFKI